MKDILEAIRKVRRYIEEAEFGSIGRVDKDDPWYPTYESLGELESKVEDDIGR